MTYFDKLFDTNFLEYASYVIKDRAIPHIQDGLKPVQRRILHTLFEMDDGKFHKVANIVGQTMKYHPHGDASIYEALVVLANKDLFIDRQGNFGNPYTGDVASAARYIECRLLPLAKEVLYRPDITEYIDSYDGRNKEPITFPAKIPVVLILGTEGIAVGMSTKILPHNFKEVLEAQIKVLKNKPFTLYPDFPTGGMADVAEYEDGNGRLTVRAKLDTSDPKRIVVRELPYGLTTETLITSIEDAARKNKIKVSGISDYTAENVEVEIRLPRGTHTDEVVDALYAFTDCQVSYSPCLTIIADNKPCVLSVTDVVKRSTEQLLVVLTKELEIEEKQLRDKLHAKTLEQIFIENRIYKAIEDKKTAETVLLAVHKGLEPFQKEIHRVVTDDDVDVLLKIPIRRISLYDIERAQREMRDIMNRLKEIKAALGDIKNFAIGFIKGLIDKYASGHQRKTTLTSIEKIDVRDAARKDLKLRYDKQTGYLGYEVPGDLIEEVSPYDRILVMRKGGIFQVMDVPEKIFIDKGMLYCGFVDKDRIFNLIYKDPQKGLPFIKRCKIEKFILNRSYELVPAGSTHVKLADPKDSQVQVDYKPTPRLKVKREKFKIDNFPLRGTKAGGVRLSDKECAFLQFE